MYFKSQTRKICQLRSKNKLVSAFSSFNRAEVVVDAAVAKIGASLSLQNGIASGATSHNMFTITFSKLHFFFLFHSLRFSLWYLYDLWTMDWFNYRSPKYCKRILHWNCVLLLSFQNRIYRLLKKRKMQFGWFKFTYGTGCNMIYKSIIALKYIEMLFSNATR